MNYHRFADDIVITVSGHHTKRKWPERTLKRLQEQLDLLKVQLNVEKTKQVNVLAGESFGFLGFDLRLALNRKGERHFVLLTPKKKARQAIKAEIRELIHRGGAIPMKDLIRQITLLLRQILQTFAQQL